MYVALTVLLLYAGNLTDAELSRRRLVRLLGWLFVVTVAGGLLGMVAGQLRVHLAGGVAAAARDPQQGLRAVAGAPLRRADHGHRRRREAAPGRAVGLHQHLGQQLLPAGRLAGGGRLADRPGSGEVLGRGLPAGLDRARRGLAQPGPVDRPRRAGRSTSPSATCWPASCGSSASSAVAGALLAVALVATPLGGVVSAPAGQRQVQRGPLVPDRPCRGRLHRLAGDRLRRHPQHARRPQLDHGRRERRLRALRQLHGRRQRPALAAALRARRRRARSATSASSRTACGGSAGTAAAIGVAGSAALVTSFSAMLWYNSLVTPLAFMVLAFALLWRNSIEGNDSTT